MYTHLNLTNRLTTCGFTPAVNHKNDVPPFRKSKLYHYDYDPTKTWLIEFYQWNVKTQKKQRRFFSRFNTIENPKKRLIEANKWVAFIDQQLEQGAVYNPDTIEVEPLKVRRLTDDLTDYLTYQKKVLTETSYKSYSGFADKWKAFAKGADLISLPSKELTPAICQEFVDYLVTLPISNTTRNNQITRLKAFCGYYMKPGRERFQQNPSRHLEMFNAKTESHDPFSDQQADRILSYIEKEQQDYQLLLFIYFIKYTFARPGKEVRLLKVKDLKQQNVRITSTYSKSSRVKTPTIPRPLADLLDQLKIREYDPNYYVFGLDGVPGPEPKDVNHFYRKHRAVLEALKIRGRYTLYGWKHTGNIKLYKATGNLSANQKQNGHASPRTTEIYLSKMGQIADAEILEKFI